jgi:hypothetical protein
VTRLVKQFHHDLPIVASSRRSNTNEEAPEVQLPQTGIRPPVDSGQVGGCSLSSLNIGSILSNGTHLGRELCEESHDIQFLRPKTVCRIQVARKKSVGGVRSAQLSTILYNRIYKLLTCRDWLIPAEFV